MSENVLAREGVVPFTGREPGTATAQCLALSHMEPLPLQRLASFLNSELWVS